MEKYKDMYDLVIVGAGPAGLSAAIYMARAKYKVLVLEKEKIGGQITITNEIVNYPGIEKTSGKELTDSMKKQAQSFGVEFKISEVLDIDAKVDVKEVKTTTGSYKTLSVILALGATPRKIGFKGEEEFAGRGVAYCATCDGEFFTDKPVYVVGGGFAAVEESIFLTKYASKINMLVRSSEFSCAKTVSDHLEEEDKISVNFNCEIMSIEGDSYLKTIKYKNTVTNEVIEETHENGFGVFVFAGYVPNTKWLENIVSTENGYIKTSVNQETDVQGLYAAGDVCVKKLRQVVTATSDGAVAATSAEKYVEALHKKLSIPNFDVQIEKSNLTQESVKKVESNSESEKFLSDEIKEGLMPIFDKFENKVCITAHLDDSDLAKEMDDLITEFEGLTSKIKTKTVKSKDELSPYIEITKENSTNSIKFYAMPGGHEFNSFILALYNMAGPGKEIDSSDQEKVDSIKQELDIKVLMSLTCTMCPDVVVATSILASKNDQIKTSIIDITKFTDIKDKYNVMSVPCMIINDKEIHFGKKSISNILDIITNK